MNMILLTTIVLPIILSQGSLNDFQWKKEKEKDGITVFTRQIADTNIKEFKAEGTIQASLSSIKKVFLDVESYCYWVSDCKLTRRLSTTDNQLIHYMEISVPFPFDNRDMIQKSTFYENENSLKIELNNLPDKLPNNKGLIRLQTAEGYWLFEEQNSNQVKATLQYISDPGGSIPAWLVNLFIVEGPIKNIQNLREMVKKEKYR